MAEEISEAQKLAWWKGKLSQAQKEAIRERNSLYKTRTTLHHSIVGKGKIHIKERGEVFKKAERR